MLTPEQFLLNDRFLSAAVLQFFRSSRRVKMSFLYEKGRAATFLLLCAYRFKKGNASLDFEQDDYEIRRRRLLPFPFSSPGRQQVLRATSLLP